MSSDARTHEFHATVDLYSKTIIVSENTKC